MASPASKIKATPTSSQEPVWKGPEVDGITSSLLQRFLNCPERFRLLVVEGLKPAERFNKFLEYGNMWHICEEAFASEKRHFGEEVGTALWEDNLTTYAEKMLKQYPFDREEVAKWWNCCRIQFPVYRKFWKNHPDVVAREPILSEESFEVPYDLPNGRTIRLRGKWDSNDLVKHGNEEIKSGIWLQENKTKSEVDEVGLRRQLKFDLPTMLYLVALSQDTGIEVLEEIKEVYPIIGVRYNVIRRPLSGGKGMIRMHAAKMDTRKGREGMIREPAETEAHFYERLKTEYIEAEPETYFFRWNAEVSKTDLKRYCKRFLDPILMRLCIWYDWVAECKKLGADPFSHPQGIHWQHPFGVRNILDEGGSSDLDTYLETGSEAGLYRTTNLFPELA